MSIREIYLRLLVHIIKTNSFNINFKYIEGETTSKDISRYINIIIVERVTAYAMVSNGIIPDSIRRFAITPMMIALYHNLNTLVTLSNDESKLIDDDTFAKYDNKLTKIISNISIPTICDMLILSTGRTLTIDEIVDICVHHKDIVAIVDPIGCKYRTSDYPTYELLYRRGFYDIDVYNALKAGRPIDVVRAGVGTSVYTETGANFFITLLGKDATYKIG